MSYLPILVNFLFLIGFVSIVYLINGLLTPRIKNSGVKMEPFECGSIPVTGNIQRISIKFFIIAILFVIFDLEIVLLYPWVLVARQMGTAVIVEGFIFIGVLAFGLLYVWRKGLLEFQK
jgi:NADH-quinone oxidoreductase subunit A